MCNVLSGIRGLLRGTAVTFRKNEFFFLLRIKTAVLHIAERLCQFIVFIDPPDQPDRKLVHNGVFHKEFFPRIAGPFPFRGECHFQTHFLAAHSGFHLFFHFFKGSITFRGFFRVVLLAGGGEVFQFLSVFVEDFYFQSRRDGHGKGSFAVIKMPLHFFIKTEVRYNAVRQFFRRDAELLCGELQGFGGGSLYLPELKLSGDAVHDKEGFGFRV